MSAKASAGSSLCILPFFLPFFFSIWASFLPAAVAAKPLTSERSSSRTMAGGTAMTRRTRVRVRADVAGLAGVDVPESLVTDPPAKGLTSKAGFETAPHFEGGGALSGAATRLALPTAAMRGPAAAGGGAAALSSSAVPKTDLSATADGREEGVAGFLRTVGAKRRAADHVAAA